MDGCDDNAADARDASAKALWCSGRNFIVNAYSTARYRFDLSNTLSRMCANERERERKNERENYSFFFVLFGFPSTRGSWTGTKGGWHRNVSKLGRWTISQSRNSPIKCKCLFTCSAAAADVYRCACIKLTPLTCNIYRHRNKIARKEISRVAFIAALFLVDCYSNTPKLSLDRSAFTEALTLSTLIYRKFKIYYNKKMLNAFAILKIYFIFD